MTRTALDGAWIKLRRAHEHIGEFQAHVSDLPRIQRYSVVEEHHAETGQTTYTYEIEPPGILAAVLGDALNNMRSALDHVAWQLALLNTRKAEVAVREGKEFPPKRTCFPVFKDELEYEGKAGKGEGAKRAIAALRDRHKLMIGRCQPFDPKNGRHPPETHALWILNELNNIDKHRRLNLVGIEIIPPPDALPPSGGTGIKRIENYADVNVLTYSEQFVGRPYTTYRRMEGIPVEVRLGDGEAPGHQQPVVPLLREIWVHVAAVVLFFTPEFD